MFYIKLWKTSSRLNYDISPRTILQSPVQTDKHYVNQSCSNSFSLECLSARLNVNIEFLFYKHNTTTKIITLLTRQNLDSREENPLY